RRASLLAPRTSVRASRWSIPQPGCAIRSFDGRASGSGRVGSGAMESLHRTPVECQIKLPGCRRLPETASGIFEFRIMAAAGRWEEFRAQPGLTQRLVEAFARPVEVHA